MGIKHGLQETSFWQIKFYQKSDILSVNGVLVKSLKIYKKTLTIFDNLVMNILGRKFAIWSQLSPIYLLAG